MALKRRLPVRNGPDIVAKLAPSKVQGAVRRLSKKSLVSSQGRGAYRIEDPELLAWIHYRHPIALWQRVSAHHG